VDFIWNHNEYIWDKEYDYLLKYVEINGNTLVPKLFKTEDGFKLGNWVATQRKQRGFSRISPERKQKLDDLGFIWKLK
jgi:hypothetical protein